MAKVQTSDLKNGFIYIIKIFFIIKTYPKITSKVTWRSSRTRSLCKILLTGEWVHWESTAKFVLSLFMWWNLPLTPVFFWRVNDADIPDESWQCIKQFGLHYNCSVPLFHMPVPVIRSYSSFHLFCQTHFLSPFSSNTVLFFIALMPWGILRNCKYWPRMVTQNTIHTDSRHKTEKNI